MKSAQTFRPPSHREGSPQRPRVLIVEDEVIVAEDLRQTLVQIGYDVAAHAASGEQAVKLYIETKPDLVLMDIVLGGEMDGIKAARHIHQCADVPIVFLTAHTDESTLRRAKTSEPCAYLVKPFEERALRATVELALSQHSVEQRLRQIERWFCPVFNSVGDAVVAVDREGKVTFMNSVAELLVGGGIVDFIDNHFEDVLAFGQEQNPARLENPLAQVLRGHPVAHLPERSVLISRSGGQVSVEGTAVPLYDVSRNLLRAVIAFRDLTAQREMRLDVQRLKEDLRQTRDSAVAQHRQDDRRLEFLIHAISHDLRSPLSALRCYTSLLADRYAQQLDAPGQDMLGALGRSILRIEEMVQGYIGLARSGGGKIAALKPVDMTALAREAIAEVCWVSGRRAVQFDCAELPPANGDRSMLRQVLVNLLSNAVKYSQNRPAARVVIAGRPAGDHSQYSIADDGIGFDEMEASQLFQPFRRLSSATDTPGLGLGLSVVKAIIDAHGGRISATSKPGCGATFEFHLPAPQPEHS